MKGNGLDTKRDYGKKINGYFTVEAALVFPFVIAVILLVIYIWFYLYDSCLMEQDYAGVMIKGVSEQYVNNNERMDDIEEKIKNLYSDQYLAWNIEMPSAEIDKGKVTISVTGSLTFPFEKLNFWNNENVWETERSYTAGILKRMFTIRTFRKIDGIFAGN